MNITWLGNILFPLLGPGFICLAWAVRLGWRTPPPDANALARAWLVPILLILMVFGLAATSENYYAGRGLTYSNLMSGATNPPARATSTGSSSRRELTASATGSNPVLRINTPMSSPRQHVVASGETPAAIARKYGIRLSALQTANPHMDARRLRPGQTLVIPSS